MNYTTNVHDNTLKTKTHFTFFFTNFAHLNFTTNNIKKFDDFKHDEKRINFRNEKLKKKF